MPLRCRHCRFRRRRFRYATLSPLSLDIFADTITLRRFRRRRRFFLRYYADTLMLRFLLLSLAFHFRHYAIFLRRCFR